MTRVSEAIFEPITRSRPYVDIAQAIGRLIIDEGYGVGDALPSEEELSRRLKAGRPLVREAVVALTTVGVIRVQNGSGLFVCDVSEGGLSQPLMDRLDLGPSLVEQIDVRRLIEPNLARIAAERISRTEIEELRSLVDRMRLNSPSDNPDLGGLFHTTVARASGRTYLAEVVDALLKMRGGRMWVALRERVLLPEHYERTVSDRLEIVDKLNAADGFGAQSAMQRLLDRTRSIYFGPRESN